MLLLLPTGPGGCPKGVSAPVLLGCACVATKEVFLGSRGSRRELHSAVTRVCKVLGACAQQGRWCAGLRAPAEAHGAKADAGGPAPLGAHLRKTGWGQRAAPGPASSLASAPCGWSLLTRKEMARKSEGLPDWMQCTPTDIFMTNLILGAFSVMCAHRKLKVAQSCLTLCDPMAYIIHGLLQARILEWVAYPFSRTSS